MVKLRLKRFGKKGIPQYRLVAIQNRTKREGESLEELGNYSPMTKKGEFKAERIKYWLSVGAQPTLTARNLLIRFGVMEKKTGVKSKYAKPAKKKKLERQTAKAEKAKKKSDEQAKASEEQKSEASEPKE